MGLSNKARMVWRELNDVPINDYGEIERKFKHFPEGTERVEIWHWIEREFGVKVGDLFKEYA